MPRALTSPWPRWKARWSTSISARPIVLAIYEANAELPGTFRLIEIRRTPDEGGGEARWATLADSLKDCRAIARQRRRPDATKGAHRSTD